MTDKYCMLCHWFGQGNLCKNHKKFYMWDESINGFRLKKHKMQSDKFHIWKHETQLAKYIESFYGKTNVIRGYHPTWAQSDRDVLLEYDILIKDKKIVIEYNGIQHYKKIDFFSDRTQTLKRRKELDVMKRKFAKVNGYKFIVFKYDEPTFKDYVIKKIEEAINTKK